MWDWIGSLIMGLGAALIFLALGGNMESQVGKFIKTKILRETEVVNYQYDSKVQG